MDAVVKKFLPSPNFLKPPTPQVIPILQQASSYVQYKSTKALMKTVLDFVDSQADAVS